MFCMYGNAQSVEKNGWNIRLQVLAMCQNAHTFAFQLSNLSQSPKYV